MESADLERLRRDAARYRWLKAALERAYEENCQVETSELEVGCFLLSQCRGHRTVLANIRLSDKTDEPLGLDEAIDTALGEEAEGA